MECLLPGDREEREGGREGREGKKLGTWHEKKEGGSCVHPSTKSIEKGTRKKIRSKTYPCEAERVEKMGRRRCQRGLIGRSLPLRFSRSDKKERARRKTHIVCATELVAEHKKTS